MYDLYRSTTYKPVTLCIYRKKFNTEFNISFFKPKKDLCDKCQAYKVIKSPTQQDTKEYDEHINRKNLGRQERNTDRNAFVNEETVCVLTFDLQNAFSLPKVPISHFFYKTKLTCYNLTAHFDKTKVVYNAVWHELICGMRGVHLANAVITVCKRIVEGNPRLEKLILWSDSCVPQNRNSIMSFALQCFLNSPESKNLVFE